MLVAVLICYVGFREPQKSISTHSLPLLVFLWNKEQITVKVEDSDCRDNVSAIIGSEYKSQQGVVLS
jgi:hypothetical protein